MQLIAVVLNWNGGDGHARGARVARRHRDDLRRQRLDRRVGRSRRGAVPAGRADPNRRESRFRRRQQRRSCAEPSSAVPTGSCCSTTTRSPSAASRTRLPRAAAARPDAGILACKILFEDGRTIQYAGATFNPRLGYSGRLTGYGTQDRQDDDGVRDVDRADGAALALSRAAYEQRRRSRRVAVHVRRGCRAVVSRASRRLRGRVRARRPGTAQGLGGKRRPCLDDESLLFGAQHDRGQRTLCATPARSARACAARSSSGRISCRRCRIPPVATRRGRWSPVGWRRAPDAAGSADADL